MTEQIRDVVIAGNWKMHKTIQEAVSFISELAAQISASKDKVYLAVPFTAISPVAEKAKEAGIIIGAQNMNDASEGAFTGEIAAKMLVEAGAKFVILGHSERRRLFSETSSFIQRKVKKAFDSHLQPLVCVGESLEERESGRAEEIIREQILETLDGISKNEITQMILAYEPVWAIGTGNTATPEDAQVMIHFCRQVVADKWGEEAANQLVIQYGGSVTPENAPILMEQSDIDGLLVGGASLKVGTFSRIVNYQVEKQ